MSRLRQNFRQTIKIREAQAHARKAAQGAAPVPVLQENLQQTEQTCSSQKDAHRREALHVLRLWERLLGGGPLQRARKDARGAARETSQLCRLRDVFLQGLGAAATPAHSHGGKAVPLHPLRKPLLPLRRAEKTHEESHWGEAVQVRKLWEGILLPPGFKRAHADPLR